MEGRWEKMYLSLGFHSLTFTCFCVCLHQQDFSSLNRISRSVAFEDAIKHRRSFTHMFELQLLQLTQTVEETCELGVYVCVREREMLSVDD